MARIKKPPYVHVLDAILAEHGFTKVSERRWIHPVVKDIELTRGVLTLLDAVYEQGKKDAGA